MYFLMWFLILSPFLVVYEYLRCLSSLVLNRADEFTAIGHW